MPIFLDPATGASVRDTRRGAPLVRSWAQMPDAPVTLDNGWTLTGFRPGYTKDLAFSAGGAATWTIHVANYPEQVLAYKNLALHAYGYLTNQAVLFAHAAGASTPTWSIDFNAVLREPERRGRVAMQILDDRLYAQVGPHLFAIQPATGAIDWHVDASVATKLPYEPELYGGALDIAMFAKDGDTLVVAYEKRVIALDAKTSRLRWHVSPDTFPATPFPIIRDGRVFLTAGAKL
jgi:outer membrane protein assembly factor BamB